MDWGEANQDQNVDQDMGWTTGLEFFLCSGFGSAEDFS
jgi:hypothetical protein